METNSDKVTLTSQLSKNQNKRKRDEVNGDDGDGTTKKQRRNKVKVF